MLKNVGQFNPDRFRQYINSPLDLSHVEQFVLEFVSRKGQRRMSPRAGLYYLITPRVLHADKRVQKKYTEVTFDQKQAMNEPRSGIFGNWASTDGCCYKICGRSRSGWLCNHPANHGSSLFRG